MGTSRAGIASTVLFGVFRDFRDLFFVTETMEAIPGLL